MALSQTGEALITKHEGKVNVVYLDPVGIPTVCVGHTGTVGPRDVGRSYSDEVCSRLLKADTRTAARAVARSVRVPISQGQFDALVSLAFNIGAGAFNTSTLVRKLNAGDFEGAAAEFSRWVYSKGRKLPGLVKRRAEERALFEQDIPIGSEEEEAPSGTQLGPRASAGSRTRRELRIEVA